MAPKKDAKKKGKEEVIEGPTSLYAKREPLPAKEKPALPADAPAQWMAVRNSYLMPLPVWDDKAVDTTEWKPTETETLFVATDFSSKILPKSFQSLLVGWRRAATATDQNAPEAPEPQTQPLPEIELEPVVVDFKAKAKAKAKADPKAKAKAKGKAEEVDPNQLPTTAAQFADVEAPPISEGCIVTVSEFRSREFVLTNDDSLPPLCQAICAQLAVIAEHRNIFPSGTYLWELIYPQNEEGFSLYNPHGKYIVKLFVQGAWRQVLVDDVIPVAAGEKGARAPLLPASASANVLWPQILSKALLRAFQADLSLTSSLPVVTALTGWLPYRNQFSWANLSKAHTTLPFCCVELPSEIDQEVRQRIALAAAGAAANSGPAATPRKAGLPGGNSSVVAGNMGSGNSGALGAAGNSLGTTIPLLPVPKLSAPAQEGIPMEFLLCEMEEEPPQVRVKASSWQPKGGSPRKTVIMEQESEAEEAEEPEHIEAHPSAEPDSDVEDLDDDDDFGRSQRSPSQLDAGDRSERSREEIEAPEELPPPDTSAEPEAPAQLEPWTPPWPSNFPKTPFTDTVSEEYREALAGGFWIQAEMLEELSKEFVTYMPPTNQILSTCSDSTWGNERKEAYLPAPPQLLTIRLNQDWRKVKAINMAAGTPEDAPLVVPTMRATLIYEPLRPDASNQEAPAAPTPFTCKLQSLETWSVSSKVLPSPSVASSELDLSVPHYLKLVVPPGEGGESTKCLSLPPGEHTFLVFDDATAAGSTLSVFVDSYTLNNSDSYVSFGPPRETLIKRGMPVQPLGYEQYPPQEGYSIWAKAEVVLTEETAKVADALQLLSYIGDPSFRQYLQVTFMKLTQEPDGSLEATERSAGWSVEILAKAPLLELMSVPLTGQDPNKNTKYILLLEANAPELFPGSKFSLDLIIPQVTLPKPPQQSEEEEEVLPDPFSVSLVSVEVEQRWSDETAPNDKDLVLRERLTVPAGRGDVFAALRVSVEGLPKAWLKAQLVAQLPPKEETRHREPTNLGPLDPLVPGAPIDPRDYSGRRNWLGRCRKVAEASGKELLIFPHVVLCEASTYLLYVKVDKNKGPANLEGGRWTLELIGSGEVEGGRDTMEEDLEELTRRSWLEKDPEPGKPTRQERAVASRKRWLLKKGMLEPSGDDVPPPENENPSNTEDIQEYQKAQERATKPHANKQIAEFLYWHTKSSAVLDIEDPYIIAENPPLPDPRAELQRRVEQEAAEKAGQAAATAEETEEEKKRREQEAAKAEQPPAMEELDEDERVLKVARFALGMEGLQQERVKEVEASKERRGVMAKQMEEAKELNTDKLVDLKALQEQRTQFHPTFLERRTELKDSLAVRYQKQSDLAEHVNNKERVDVNALGDALSNAREYGVQVWNEPLLLAAEAKLDALQRLAELKAALEAAAAAPPPPAPVEGEEVPEEGEEETPLKALARILEATEVSLKKLEEKKVLLSPDLNVTETVEKAVALARPPEVPVE